jgi:ABC-type nitrate/sulfonate/bicarbonate transport system permease component
MKPVFFLACLVNVWAIQHSIRWIAGWSLPGAVDVVTEQNEKLQEGDPGLK